MASYLSYFVGKVVPGARSPLSDFAYELGEAVPTDTTTSVWTLYKGKKKADKSPASLFVFDASKSRPDALPLARNAFKRWKTLRHPLILPYLDGVDAEGLLVVATHPVTPLAAAREQVKANEQLAFLGLFQILKTLAFLNEDCTMVHGALCFNNVYLNDAGEFKLLGFDLLGPLTDDSLLYNAHTQLPGIVKYRPPDVANGDWSKVRGQQAWAVDVWAFGCFIFELFNGPFNHIEQIKTKGDIPGTLFLTYKDLLKGDGRQRPQPSQLLERLLAKGMPFSCELVQSSIFIETIALKDAHEKDAFFRRLGPTVETFPQQYNINRILPELIKALEFGAAGAKALAPLIAIGNSLPADEFEARVVDAIIKLFASPDRQMRATLLEMLPSYIDRIPVKTVSERLFPHLVRGFLDAAPALRDQTIKAMITLAPKLSETLLNGDVLKYFAKCQTDEEPGIRTNTTICLGKIAHLLTPATKKKVLPAAFGRALRDPFAPSREAGLKALCATVEVYSAEDIALKLLPAMSPLMVDPEPSVRQLAVKSCQQFVKTVETAPLDNPPGPSGPGPVQQQEDSWGSWAMQSITKKLVGDATPSIAPKPPTQQQQPFSSTSTSGLAAPLTATPTPSSLPAPLAATPALQPTQARQSMSAAPAAARAPSKPLAPTSSALMDAPVPTVGMALGKTASTSSTSGWESVEDLLLGDPIPSAVPLMATPIAAAQPALNGWSTSLDDDFNTGKPSTAQGRRPLPITPSGAASPASVDDVERRARENRRQQRRQQPRAPQAQQPPPTTSLI